MRRTMCAIALVWSVATGAAAQDEKSETRPQPLPCGAPLLTAAAIAATIEALMTTQAEPPQKHVEARK